jgi:hypothetical protein
MKKKLVLLLLLSCIVICSQPTHAQTRDSVYISSVCDSIMKGFLKGDYSKAMQLLKKNSVMGDAVDKLEETILDQMSKAATNYGKTCFL